MHSFRRALLKTLITLLNLTEDDYMKQRLAICGALRQ